MEMTKFIVMICLLLAGSARGGTEGEGEEEFIMPEHTYTDDSSPIRVEVGISFHIVLDSNATTGYSWRLAERPDNGVVEDRGERYLPPSTTRRGAGGKEIWSFRAVGVGEALIKLEYIRPWETGKPPARTREFTVIVVNSG